MWEATEGERVDVGKKAGVGVGEVYKVPGAFA